MKHHIGKRGGAALAVGLLTAATAVVWPVAASAASACTPNVAGSRLSAAVVAKSGQTIADRTIATSCDIGIFIGPGTSRVTVNHVTVTGAHYQGILAENASHIIVENSTITGNGFHTINPHAPALPGSGLHSYVGQSFAISMFGVTSSTVRGNTVNNNGRGGIGVMDNGANNPGTIAQNRSAKLVGSAGVSVTNNTLTANYNGCGVVAATQNFGGHLTNIVITGNTITGTGMDKTKGPDTGGIVVAADLPNSTVRNALVSGNTVTKSFEGGVIVNAEAPNSATSNVMIVGNTLSANNWGKLEAPSTAGVVVFGGPGAANVATNVTGNTITGQFYGIWASGNSAPTVFGNTIRVLPKGVVFARP
jgi:parallel beta-helix repeat protein